MNKAVARDELGEMLFSTIRPGASVAIEGGASRATLEIVDAALRFSWKLGGAHVRCADVLPGVVMRVSVDASATTTMALQKELSRAVLQTLRPHLIEWLSSTQPTPGFKITLGHIAHFEFGWSDSVGLLEAAMHLSVRHEKKFCSRYMKQRKRFPLVEHDGQTIDKHRNRELLLDALKKGIQSNHAKYARLPAPVRYRVTGALEAWRSFRRTCEADSSASPFDVLDFLPITNLVKIFGNMTKNMFPYDGPDCSSEDLTLQASHSAVWQAFEARDGVFYEPSPALHHLLDASYIADDVGIGHLQLPANALCIIPEPSRWSQPGGCESIVMFKLLDQMPERIERGEHGSREVGCHWRRPYFKMQHHGPGATQRKLVFIGPTIVRADRLTG